MRNFAGIGAPLGAFSCVRAASIALALAVVTLVAGRADAQRSVAIIESVEPTSGPPGTVINVVGRQFPNDLQVLLGGVPLEVTMRLPNRVSARVPANTPSGQLILRASGGDTLGPQFVVTTAPPAPTVQRIDPAGGAPGTEVVITGTNFSPRPTENIVTLGGRAAVVRSATPFALRVIVPEGATTGPFSVRVTGAGEVATPPFTVNAATMIADFQPRFGPPGSQVTLTGTGFSPQAPQNRVFLNNVPMRVERASATQLVVWVPANAASGPILVDVRGAGRAQTPTPFNIQFAPTLAGFAPTASPPGREVILRGTNFGTDVRVVQVTLGGQPVQIRAVAQTQITVVIPSNAPSGRFAVTVNGVGPVTATTDFSVLTPLAITDFQPRSGPAQTEVVLRGQGFSPNPNDNVVTLSGVRAQLVSAAPTELRVRIPAAPSGAIEVTVANNGTTRTNAPFVVTVPPFVAGFDPQRGEPGALVHIRGTSFGTNPAVLDVTLGGRPMQIRAISDTSITVVVPADAVSGTITVSNRAQGASTSSQRFEVIPVFSLAAIDPPQAPEGALVSVRGQGFAQSGMRVQFGPLQAPGVAFVSTAELRVAVPRGARTGVVTVRHPDGRVVTSTTPFTVTIPPTIAGFEPARGEPGAIVTVRGTAFGTVPGMIDATLGGRPAVVQSATDTALTLVVPQGAVTGPITIAVRGQGSVASTTAFEILGAFAVASVEPATGTTGTSVLVRGSGFAQGMRVDFGAAPSATTFLSPTEIRAGVPALPAGAVQLVVRHPDGRAVTVPTPFTVVAPPSGVGITLVEVACTRPGCQVILRGYGFSARTAQNRVFFGETPVRVRASTPAEILLDLPVSPGTQPFRVDVRNVGIATSPPFTITPN